MWRGNFIDYNGISFNGVHGRHPRIAGATVIENPTIAGWGKPADGSFDDERVIGRDGRKYGPLSKDWLRYKGLYRSGIRTVLSYEIGKTAILESPSLAFVDEQSVVSRNFQIGPRSHDLVLQVANFDTSPDQPLSNQKLLVFNSEQPKETDSSKLPANVSFGDGKFLQSKAKVQGDLFDKDFCIYAEIKSTEDGTIVAQTRDQSDWLPNGKTFFIRGGRLHYDIGWVGVVHSDFEVDSGQWTAVAMNYEADSQQVSFFADGRYKGADRIAAKKNLRRSVMRIGYTNDDFPSPSSLSGKIRSVKVFDRCLRKEELDKVASVVTQPVMSWDSQRHDESSFAWRAKEQPEISNEAVNLLVHTSLNPQQFRWERDENGNLRLRILAGQDELKFAVNVAVSEQLIVHSKLLSKKLDEISVPHEFSKHQSSFPPNWRQRLTTEIQTLKRTGPFDVDVLTRPETNPWNDRLRFTGVDFVDNGSVAIVCCWDGSVYRVEGVTEGKILTWQRIATGLFQPLGVKVVDGQIYVCCRDQIVLLKDLNGDHEIDFYKNFNSDHQVTEHFHEFAMGLQTDDDGNFYYAKSARHALKAVVPHHGTLLKVDSQGEGTTIVANGFRAANGVCLNADGSFIVTDQEGHWNPKNRINWVQPGGFYGNMFGYHDVENDSDDAMDKPLCWITNAFDRSPAELLWVDSEKWGALNGSLLNFSYGHGKIYVVPFEDIDGQKQGGMCALPLPEFPTGIMRGRFNSADGQLYACGMFAWSSNRQQPGGFYRVRYGGEPVHLPIGIAAAEKELRLTFSGDLDAESVSELKNFRITCWDLKRTANYGSKHYNERELEIGSAELLQDGRTVRLAIDDLAPTRGMEIEYSLTDTQGQRVRGKIHNTIHLLD